jgi:hypothetical protein
VPASVEVIADVAGDADVVDVPASADMIDGIADVIDGVADVIDGVADVIAGVADAGVAEPVGVVGVSNPSINVPPKK